MLLLELTTLTMSSRFNKLGIDMPEDRIEVETSINIDHITHLSVNPDNSKLTNIYLTNGACLVTPYSFTDVRKTLAIDTSLEEPVKIFNNVKY